MSKSVKLQDNAYLDSTGIVHKKKLLSEILSEPVSIKHYEEEPFLGIKKERIIDEEGYVGTFGVGLDKTVAIEILKDDVVLGRLGVSIDGTIKNWKTGKQLVETPDIVTNSTGTAIKYSDGTMICYGEVSSASKLVAWGSLYGYDDNTVRTFPQAFTSKPRLVVTNVGSSASMVHRAVATASAITQISYCRTILLDSTYVFNYIAIGRWK